MQHRHLSNLLRRTLLFLGTVIYILVWGCSLFRQAESPPAPVLGDEIFCREFPKGLKGKRLGLVINHTSRLSNGMPLWKALQQRAIPIGAIFTPEHGLKGNIEGGTETEGGHFQRIPVFSLYGTQRRPLPEQLAAVDVLVYDIQDIGTRFYTYITTLKYTLEAAAEAGLPVYILDRPNPLGGEIIEGPILDPQLESFIGAAPVPIRYGLTCGELALMMRGEGWVQESLDLHVIPMRFWQRSRTWRGTGSAWTPPSPNIPSPESALLYPGTALLGGIILNQGLGTELPYLQFGAPWLNRDLLLKRFPQNLRQEIQFEPVTYQPRALPGRISDPPYRNQICSGFKIIVRQPDRLRTVHFALHLIKTIKEIHPDKIYRESERLSRMFGNLQLAAYLNDEISFQTLWETMQKDEGSFREQRKKYLLYK